MEENAKFMCTLFKSNKPFLVGRNGTIELQVLTKYYYGASLTSEELDKLELNAGIFPQDSVSLFCQTYKESLENVDAIAEGWYIPLKKYEEVIMDTLNQNRYKLLLRNLEPYYVKPELRWTQYLEGKRVAIVNAFADICETQTYMSKAVWPHDTESLLPSNTTWIPINTFYSPRLANGIAQWPDNIHSWSDAVDFTVERVVQERCDVAIIGCGGMGMIIGHELKKRGLQCIVMGGATQILFGIRGRRWDTHETISKFFNDAWVVPPNSCKPRNAKLVENGCYW
uniref:Uncharacterized protein n=1 Tax=viral metagenome TaxID=1070528 RepID=A0A6C0D960_9ZZZZ